MARPILSFAASALALTILVATTACAPSPEDVCDHMLDVAEREGLPEGEAAQRDACIEHVESEKERMGYMAYRSEASCVLDAEGIEAIRACADGG